MNKILFITIEFYGYIEKIKSAIESTLSAEVDVMLLGCEVKKPIYYLDKVLGHKIRYYKNNKIQREFYINHADIKYDYIFVLVGRGINYAYFYDFIKEQERATKILYLWDDVARVNEFDTIKPAFDIIKSFDLSDCQKYGFSFLPLFYCDEYLYNEERKDIDISFTGAMYYEREQLIKKIIDDLEEQGNKLNTYIKLKTTKANELNRKLKSSNHRTSKYASYNELSINENAEILKRSKIVLDIPNRSQTGLSIRTIESIAANTKIITTNKNILKYDFFCNDNVYVIDENNPVVSVDFLGKEFTKLDDKILEKYSLSEWIKELFDLNLS